MTEKKKMPDWIKFPLTLLVVTLISAASLAALYSVTLPKKKAMQKKIEQEALKVVMPEADSFEIKIADLDGEKFQYRIAKKGGREIGYVAQGHATGYSSILQVMVGVDKKFVVQGIKVLYQKETPGLGDKVEEILSKKTWGTIFAGTSPDETGLRPWFQVQFDNKKVPVKVNKDGGDIDAITGATISSRAVCNAVNEAVSGIQKALK
ncbi:MAG: RnfABCDGE type electron transport complex subunit G [Deltaproteobacteria bacterium]|jgi:Na+-translocating ferredoxin:NAD+ oxidoreductase subunit G|nr:RnfABCDGE type electron transport complex subunit G [Deltaproteobacteria bacterium]